METAAPFPLRVRDPHRTPLQRIARVNDLDPVLSHKEGISDPVEEAINKFSFSVQTLVVVFLLTMLLIIGVLGDLECQEHFAHRSDVGSAPRSDRRDQQIARTLIITNL